MKIKNLVLVALLSSTTMMAGGFDDSVKATGNAVEQVTDATKGQTRAKNAHLTANNKQENSGVKQNGLVNINRNGTISIAKGTNLNNATMKAKNVQKNSKVKQNGLKNVNENGSIVVGKP